MDTIDRRALNFDFAKFCSVTMSTNNVYVCLVCGSLFQGKGPSTPAYTHAVSCGHYVFMALRNDKPGAEGRVFVLPDNYEVVDRSLDDIRHELNPSFTREQVQDLDKSAAWANALDGSDYMPGLVGLNDLAMANNPKRRASSAAAAGARRGSSDYLNVVVQALQRVRPLRDHLLLARDAAGTATPALQATETGKESAAAAVSADGSNRAILVLRFGELVRKVWHPNAFKGHVSPHEFMQAVQQASKSVFNADTQGDPQAFLAWLLDAVHLGLTGGKRKKASIVTQCFQGELEVCDLNAAPTEASASAPHPPRTNFLMLGLDLPVTPLYQDKVSGTTQIPQVSLSSLLKKYDGTTVNEATSKTYRITRLPQYLVLHAKRFQKVRKGGTQPSRARPTAHSRTHARTSHPT